MTDPVHDFLLQIKGMWGSAVGSISTSRLKPILNKEILLQVSGGADYAIHLGKEGIKITEGETERPDATVRMSKADWEDVVSGKVSIMSVVLAGRCPYPKDERLPISKLSIVFQSLATTRDEVQS